MKPRQEITALCLGLIVAAVALLGCVGLEAHEVDKYQARWMGERAVRVRVETMCRSRADGSAECDPGTFDVPAATTTTVTP